MLKSFFSKQARRPSGFFGRIVASRIFERRNAALNNAMLELVAASGKDNILEIGFGNGRTIYSMANSLNGGVVEGIDFSDAMMVVATKKNGAHIQSGTVKLVHGDFDVTNYEPLSFDTICTANTIYFWPDRTHTVNRIYQALKPGGRFVLAYIDKSKMKDMPVDNNIFFPISRAEIKGLLKEVGFSNIYFHSASDEHPFMLCVEAIK